MHTHECSIEELEALQHEQYRDGLAEKACAVNGLRMWFLGGY